MSKNKRAARGRRAEQTAVSVPATPLPISPRQYQLISAYIPGRIRRGVRLCAPGFAQHSHSGRRHVLGDDWLKFAFALDLRVNLRKNDPQISQIRQISSDLICKI
jgi:hypothetical protein